MGLVGYLSSHIQRAIVEWLLNIFPIVIKLTKVDWRNIESEKVNVRYPELEVAYRKRYQLYPEL